MEGVAAVETMLIRERYKVTRVLHVEEDYALLEAVDIQDRETPQRLLNIYEGPLLRRYAGIYGQMPQRPDYHGIFLAGESLVAAFDDSWGRNIDQVFYQGDNWDWHQRLGFAQALMHCALSLADLPPEVGCSAFLSENLLVDIEEQRFRLRFKIPPMETLDRRELTFLVSDQIRKIFRPRFSSTDAELRFLDCLDQMAFPGIVPLYARWLEERETIRAEYEQLDRKDVFKRWCTLLVKNVMRKLRRNTR